MIARRCLTLTVSIYLILSIEFGAIQAERWSRQISNSEWIPLANPRATQAQIEQSNPAAGLLASSTAQIPQVPQIALPPALQQQYQEQLLQLQKTQENIQKLLLLQQQLRAQQQLLQSQGFLPSGFSNTEEEKRLHDSGLGSSQTVTDIAPEDLVPPLPATEALPPVFPAQNFLAQRPRVHPPQKQDGNVPQDFANLPGRDFKSGHLLSQGQAVGDVGQVEQIQENQRPGSKHLKDANHAALVPQGEAGQDEEEEVQLVYVPAETLAQRGHPKRPRGRKYPLRHQQHLQYHQHRENQGVDSGVIANEQDTYSQQLLQQIQREREEKAQLLKEERMKEIARLNEEQKALERKARLQQEALQREQEMQKQREAEKKKKELEKLEEMAKQRELERIREAREKQRLEELERRRVAEMRIKEEKRRAEEAARQREAERIERQRELEAQEALKQQRLLEKQREEEARVTGSTIHQEVPAQALPLVRDQQEYHRQHLSEKPLKGKVRGRQRQRHQYQEQQYRETTTTPSPNQPPLSVYMGSSNSRTTGIKVSDVLRLLKNAKTIAVLDTVGPDTPQVFVGPTSLEPPLGYTKFDLPYLSSIDHNRVERKVDKLPFFVAPLSFDPPPGYSKIPFPAPHIGSVVVNTLDNTDPKDGDDQNPSPTPLIEPNSYSDGLDGDTASTTPSYEPQTTVGYSQEPSSTPKYEQTYSSTPSSAYSGGRFRFRQYYGEDKPASVVSTSYYDDQRPTTRKKYYDENLRTTESPLQTSKVQTSVSHLAGVSYSTTPSFREGPTGPQDPATKEQELAAQLALINQELNQQRETQRYNTGGQYSQEGSQSTTSLGNNFEGEISAGDINDVRAPVGPTQYSLPAELPAISPHLPGLVNSLLDKNEAKLQASSEATTTTTTTTTTTQRTPTTTYRPRSRQRTRVSSTRPRSTTQAPTTKANVDRSKRPYNRSRSRFSTTTEEYRESYEPTKSRVQETTPKYSAEQRRPASRTQKYRGRDKANQQSEQSYDNVAQLDSSPPTGSSFLQPTAPETSLRQLDSTPSLNDFSPENYPSGMLSTTENYPSLAVNQGSPLVSEDYSRSQSYPQTLPDQSPYRGYDQPTLEQTGLEKTPVNGFNYQAQHSEDSEQGILQRPKNYQVDGKAEISDFDLATTMNPRLRTDEEQRYSSIYDVNVPQTQPVYSLTGQDNLHHLESEKIHSSVMGDPNEQPIFIPLAENKQEDYELPVSSTEVPLADVTTETTTTSTTPVVIRQRLRSRVGTRLHHEPSVQTRTRGSQDEYVRFNVVNQESRTIPRQRTRSRTRTQNQGSQVQTDGNEYIKIHVAQQQRQATTTSLPTTTTTARPTEEDIDYGFIRPPSFRPVHPVDNRFQAPVTFRPQLTEVPQQSLLPNDETAVESSLSQTQLPKIRPKYQPAPNRRLSGKPTTLPPSPTTTPIETTTTTERIPVATVLPDDAIYTVKPKSRPDETKQTRDHQQTRVRGRVRRPGKKRVTTTTESTLDAHNELPLDENYPRVRPQQVTTEQQQNLFEDNYDNGGQFSPARNPTAHQFYEGSSENYPSEFILNFGNYPEQGVQREEYDQTQLASSSPRKFSQPAEAKDDAHSTTADIYGAESQWSTKLTRTSFQPSFAVNQVSGGVKDREWFHESQKNAPEIITAAPEVSSVTLVVSSDDKRKEEEDESMLMGTTMFGMKTGTLDHTEKMNANASATSAPATITRDGSGSETETSHEAKAWLMDSAEGFTERQSDIDLEKIQKKAGETPAAKKGTRRRRVRVRVRPTMDDFVTAESQHFNSALNGLYHDQHKYNPIRESKLPTTPPSLSEKSVFQDFLTEILKSDVPTVKSTTTESPEVAWTMSPAMTTPMIIPDDVEGTTLSEDQAATEKPEDPATTMPYEDMVSLESRDKIEQNEKAWGKKKVEGEKKKTKEQDRWKPKDETWNGKNIEDALDIDDFKKYTKENDVKEGNTLKDDSEAIRSESLGTSQLKAIDSSEEMDFGKVSEKEVTSDSFEISQESKDEDHYAHPKNHRAKWSEVRYPSAFDRSQASAWNKDPKKSKPTSAIPGLVTKTEGDNSVKTLSDYVKAIFDSMKSADEETTTGKAEGIEVTTIQVPSETEVNFSSIGEEEKSTMKDVDPKVTTQTTLTTEETMKNGGTGKETTQTTESATDIDPQDATTLERVSTTSESATSSSAEPLATDPPTTPRPTITIANTTESILGKVLRTSTTTRVSHMTEICYRGRCVMTKPSQDDRSR